MVLFITFITSNSSYVVQVETSIFAMNFKQPPSSVQSKYNTSSGESDLVFRSDILILDILPLFMLFLHLLFF